MGSFVRRSLAVGVAILSLAVPALAQETAIAGTVWLPEGLGARALLSERLADNARFIAASLPIIWLA